MSPGLVINRRLILSLHTNAVPHSVVSDTHTDRQTDNLGTVSFTAHVHLGLLVTGIRLEKCAQVHRYNLLVILHVKFYLYL